MRGFWRGRHHRLHIAAPISISFHTGIVAFGKGGELLLRNASQSRGRVVDDRMTAFVTVNPVTYVTLLRAAENVPVVERR